MISRLSEDIRNNTIFRRVIISLVVAIVFVAICSGLLIGKYRTNAKLAYESLEKNALNEAVNRLRGEVRGYARQLELIATGPKLRELLEYKRYGFYEDYEAGLNTLISQLDHLVTSDKLNSRIEISQGKCIDERLVGKNTIRLCRTAGPDHIVTLTVDTNAILKEISGKDTSQRLEFVTTKKQKIVDDIIVEPKYLKAAVWDDVLLQYRRNISQLDRITSGPLFEIVGILILFLVFLVAAIIMIWRKYLLSINKILDAISVGSHGDLSTIELNECPGLEGIVEKFNEMIQSLRSVQELRTQAILGQSSALIAHDMRSPLSVLKGYVAMPGADDDPEMKEYQAAAQRSVDKLLHMADDLVDYSKASKVERAQHDVKKLICDNVISETKKTAAEHGVSVRCEIDKHILANIDAYRMERVLVNLVNNAVQAIDGKGGEVVVRAEVDQVYPTQPPLTKGRGGDLVISVVDNGKGISSEDLSHVFDSFFTKGKKGGTGLGLAYCKQVV
ncbi:MAG: HAMP domain-containing sensor histidine kinase, partial [Parcubacteria group bacterium]